MQPLSDNIIVWMNSEGRLIFTQMIDDTIDVDAEILKIQEDNPDLTFKMKGKMSELKIRVDEFYSALVVTEDNKIAYDMAKARNIWRDRLRFLRDPVFAQLDIDYQKADERNDLELKAEIAAKKTTLRDCTKDPRIDEAQNIRDLRKTLPALLGE